MTRSLGLASVAAAALAAVTATQAGVVTFDADDDYTAFISLDGQPFFGPQWTGSGENYTVVRKDPLNVEETDFVAQSLSDGAVSNAFSKMSFTPDASFLGGSTDATGQFDYSLQIRNDSVPTSEDFDTAHIIRIANDGATDSSPIRLNVFDNGRIQHVSVFGSTNVVDNGGANLDLDDTTGFITIEGVLDFDARTYTIAVDGVPQLAGSNPEWNFAAGTALGSDFGDIALTRGNSTDVAFRQISIDNITVTNQNPSALVGDYNGDGLVDGADYTAWRDGGPLANETASPGVVDSADYDAWVGNFGASAASGVAAIPEPAAVVSVLSLVGLVASRRRV